MPRPPGSSGRQLPVNSVIYDEEDGSGRKRGSMGRVATLEVTIASCNDETWLSEVATLVVMRRTEEAPDMGSVRCPGSAVLD